MNSRQRLLLWPAIAVTAAVLFLSSAIALFAPLQTHAASAAISVSGGSTPLSVLSVSGSGFAPNEPIKLSLGVNSGTATADSGGNFTGASITIPNVPSGNYIVIAVGQNSGITAFSFIYVSAFFPNASPSGWYVNPGSTLTWGGSGFAPNEQVTVMQGTTQVAQFNADGSGNFSGLGASTVPYSAHGTSITYNVKGASSGANIPITISVANLYGFVNPSSWYILPGSQVTFSGGGFGAGENIRVFYATSATPVAQFSADSSGAFTGAGQVTIPYGTGVAQYTLVGDQSSVTAVAPITRALFYPSLSPSAYYSAPGSTITLGGSGFAPNETVNVTVGGTAAGSAQTDSQGAFSGVSIKLPATPNTSPTVMAVGQTSGATASYAMAIGAYYSWINLSTWWAQGGMAEIISGHNFLAGETVTATSNGQTLGSGVANNTGDVTINATVPFVVPGPATITATGGSSGASGSATMTVAQVWTDFELGSYAGAPGAAVTFVGHGYLPNEKVDITTDRTGTTPVLTITTDNTGSFNDSTWHIPAGWAMGNLLLTATSEHSFNTASITYFVTGS